MNLTTLISRIQRLFGDDIEVQITSADIIAWASDGQQEIARDTESYQKEVLFSVADPNTFVGHSLPDDFVSAQAVEFDKTPLARTSRSDLQTHTTNIDTTKSSAPTHYYTWSEKLYIWPYPDVANTNKTKLFYIALPPPLTTSADPLVIPDYQHLQLIDYVMWRAHQRNEDPEQANRHRGDYDSRMAQSRDEAYSPRKDQYPVIRDDPGDQW